MTHKASRRCSWDHPRERGENQVNRLTRECSAGRTTDLSTQLIHGPGPPHARAGRTDTLTTISPSGWDHPRERGENLLRAERAERGHGRRGHHPRLNVKRILPPFCRLIAWANASR
jgi:hypothetical protein